MATLQAQSPSLSLAFCSPARLPAPSSSVRIPALDGLRGIAILLVLLRHGVFGLQTSSPILQKFLVLGQLTWSGVDLFFVLSGFLIGGYCLTPVTHLVITQPFMLDGPIAFCRCITL